jgi:FkbM family methyltransferase
MIRRGVHSALSAAQEIFRAALRAGNLSSGARLGLDILLARGLNLGLTSPDETMRTVKLRTGETICYTLNQGDLQSIREVMLEEGYRPPQLKPRVIVDLGANIGLTSVYYHRLFADAFFVCVEPDDRNLRLLHENVRCNGLHAEIIPAAASSTGGMVAFVCSGASNMGHVSEGDERGEQVRAVTMDEILRLLPKPSSTIDLLKVDIEGHEEELLTRNNGWLNRVGAIIIELHPPKVNCQRIIDTLAGFGLVYHPAAPPSGSRRPGPIMDMFWRVGQL